MLDALYLPPGRAGGNIIVSTTGPQGLGPAMASMRVAVANVQWPTANVALYMPVVIPEAGYATKLWWAVSNGAGGGNMDIGIYDESYNRLVSSGSTAIGTSQGTTVVDITDTLLQPGRYYVGLASDTSSGTSTLIGFAPAAGICQALGVIRQTSAFALPSTATPVITTHAALPTCGIQMYRAVGP